VNPDQSSADEQRAIAPPETDVKDVGTRRRGWRRFVRPGLILLLLLVVGFFAWRRFAKKRAQSTKSAAAAAPTHVIAATARKGNIPVYVTGLGTVIPIYTVTLTSRIDGQLMKVLYTEGQMVHENDLLAEIDPRPYQVMLTQAEGTLLRDQALLDNARIDLARYETLWSKNAIQEQQVATQRALVTQDEGNVKSDQGQIDNAKLDLVYCEIVAPITGRVGLRLIDPGNLVGANSTTLVVLTQIQPISVIFTIGEEQLPAVRQGFKAGKKFPVAALDRADSHPLAQGSLETIDNQIDPTTGTVKLRAVFDNKNDGLFPQQFVNARLLLQMKQGVTLLPNAAVQRNTSTTYVWLVGTDGTVHVRNVAVGATSASDSEITSGLSPGDVAVTDGVDRLREGSKVAVQMNNPAQKSGG